MAYPLTEKAEHLDSNVSVAGIILIATRALLVVLCLIVYLPFHYLLRLFRLPSPMPRLFLRSVAAICGARIKSRGNRLKTNVFYTANHITWFDIPVIAGMTGCTFIAQDGIKNWPIVGWLCRINHTIFISRENRMAVGGQIEVIRSAIEEKYPITVFPEGTTTDGNSLLPFKPSLFAAMAPPPKPIMVQPLLLDYGQHSEEICWVGDEGAPENAKKLFSRFARIPITLYFLEPFNPDEYGNRKEICAEAERRITTALSASLSGEPVI